MRVAIAPMLILLLVLAAGAHAASGRTEIEPYTIGGGLLTSAVHFCDTDEGNVGGVCFRLVGDEGFADIGVDDAAGPVPATARTYGANNEPLSRSVFCATATRLPIPAEARKLVVFIGPLADTEKLNACDDPPLVGSYGDVTARFY